MQPPFQIDREEEHREISVPLSICPTCRSVTIGRDYAGYFLVELVNRSSLLRANAVLNSPQCLAHEFEAGRGVEQRQRRDATE